MKSLPGRTDGACPLSIVEHGLVDSDQRVSGALKPPAELDLVVTSHERLVEATHRESGTTPHPHAATHRMRQVAKCTMKRVALKLGLEHSISAAEHLAHRQSTHHIGALQGANEVRTPAHPCFVVVVAEENQLGPCC